VYNAINDIFNLQKRRTPWVDIFTSLPMWAIIIAHTGQNWGLYTLLTEMPSYMNSILNFDLTSVSRISCNIQFHTRVVMHGGAAGM
jgi:broad specificity phosphatase PhoE